MDWDDEYDNMDYSSRREEFTPDRSTESGIDPMDIADPASAYFFLSDDAQDEITGTGKTKMNCLSCGHRFMGEIYDRCPECDSLNTEEAISILDDEEDLPGRANMKCLDCGHIFVGEIYDRCPECFSSDTEQTTEENDDSYW